MPATSQRTVVSIPCDQLRPDPNQPRKSFPLPALEALGESLKGGQIHPCICWPDPEGLKPYLIGDGERRWRAAQMAGIASLDWLVMDRPLTRKELLEFWMSEDGHKVLLSSLERANIYGEYMTLHDLTQEECAAKFGISQSLLSRIVNLPRDLDKELHGSCDAKELSASHWFEIVRLTHKPQQLEAYAWCKESGANRDQLKKWVDAKLGKDKSGKVKPLKAKEGGRRFEVQVLEDDTHEKLVEFHKAVIAKIMKAQRDGIALKDIGVLFNGK